MKECSFTKSDLNRKPEYMKAIKSLQFRIYWVGTKRVPFF